MIDRLFLGVCVVAVVLWSVMSEKLRRSITYMRTDKRTGKSKRSKVIEISRECRMGSSKQCDIILNTETIAPVQALLVVSVPDRPGIMLINVVEDDKLLLNDKPVTSSTTMSSGDTITIGTRHFLYEEYKLVEPSKQEEQQTSAHKEQKQTHCSNCPIDLRLSATMAEAPILCAFMNDEQP